MEIKEGQVIAVCWQPDAAKPAVHLPGGYHSPGGLEETAQAHSFAHMLAQKV
jgi:hypothetical protein